MIRLILLFFMLWILIPVEFIQGQENETIYVKVDYMKAPKDQISNYTDMERNVWKPVHEERLRQGVISRWGFYSVMAGEPDVPYNYIVVNYFDDFDKIDYYRLNDMFEKVHPDKEMEKLIQKTQSTREVVRTEIWQVNGKVLKEGKKSPGGAYITVNYFDARGGSGEHALMELDFWGKIHEVRLDKEILNSWAMYTLLYPGGDARQYTYSTIDFYDSLGDLREPVGMQLAKIAHPDLTEDELSDYFNRTGLSRTLYKTELWKLIDSVDAETIQN